MSSKILLSLHNITKTFTSAGKTIQALKGVSLNIYEGEIISLLGVNGAGKTTLSSIIASLTPATSGSILYQGTSIYQNLMHYRSIIGLCPQKPNIDSMLSIQENLYFAGRYFGMSTSDITQRSHELMRKFGLLPYADMSSAVLSGGYKQRFLFARTLMHHPKLILLDEPTVAIDPHIRQNLWKIIKDLKKEGYTIILTTHYLDEAEYLSDRVCILDQGVIAHIDTPENLKQIHQESTLEKVFIKLMNEQIEHIQGCTYE